jgi:dolichol-phosphate mannosyltransferase
VKLAVVIGVYDERETIAELTRRLISVLDGMKDWRWELIYVIEGVDGTREIAEQLAAGRPEIRVLYREQPSGLGAAFRLGFAAVSADADLVVTMDADLNHQPEEIPRLVETALRRQADIVVGSRFIAGGRAEGTPLWKAALSRTLNAVMRAVFGLVVRDKTSGFRVYRSAVIRELHYRGDNFAFLPEILIGAHRAGLKVSEEPIRFIYREQGHSKMDFWSTTWSYLSLFGGEEYTAAAPKAAADRRIGWVPTLAALAVVAAFLLSLEMAHPYYFLQDDNRDMLLPFYALAARTLAAGDVAQYNFFQALGTPLLATGQAGVLNPAVYLAVAGSRVLFGHVFAAIDLLVAAYFLAGAAGMLFLARHLGLSRAGGIFAALSWPLLPATVYLAVSWIVVAPLVGLLPWIVAVTLRLVRGGGVGSALGLAAAHALLFLAGYPPWTAYTVVAQLLLLAVLLPGAARPVRALGWLALSAVLAGLWSLPLLAPLVHQTSVSWARSTPLSYARFAGEALRPVALVNGLLWPFGRLFTPSVAHYYSEVGAPASMTHLGFPALALAVTAFVGIWRRRAGERRGPLVACALGAAVMMAWVLGWLSPVIYPMAVFNRFRWPVRVLLFFVFYAILLAGFGLDRARSATRRWLPASLIVFQVLNLWLANLLHHYRGFVAHTDPVPLIEPWRDRLAGARIVSLGHYALGGRLDTVRSVGFNYPSLWGLFHMGGYDTLTTRASYDATRSFSHMSSFADRPELLDIDFLRSWCVRWYVASPGAFRAYSQWLASHGVKLVECDGDRCLFEDASAPPLAAWADSGRGDGLRLRVEGGELAVSAQRDSPGDVVLGFLDHPFLHATVDGSAAQMRRLPAGQIVVGLPAGDHELRLRYDDPLFRLGCRGAAAGVVLAALVTLFEMRAARKRRLAQAAGPAT